MRTAAWVLGLLGVMGPAIAQTPLGTSFTYQGVLRDGGQLANGLFDIQVCAFDAATGPIPLACSPEFNDQPVEQGVFTLNLDFGSGMFSGQQRFLELRVRPGASTGGYTILLPRQLLRATPEALRATVASGAPWSGLTGVPADLADGDQNSGGTVTQIGSGAGLTGGPITTAGSLSVDFSAVQARLTAACPAGQYLRQVNADGSVVCGVDGNSGGSVTSVTAGTGLTGGTITGSGTIAIANGGVGAAQVNPAQVQVRVTGVCPAGEFMRGVNSDGSVVCASTTPLPVSRALDTTGDVGHYSSVGIRSDQRPIISYLANVFPGGGLRVFDCLDPECSSGAIRSLDAEGNSGYWTSMVVRGDDRPLIAYWHNSTNSLRLYDCATPACDSGTVRTLDPGVGGDYTSIALRQDGTPIISYRDGVNFDLKVYVCSGADCSSGAARTLDSAGQVGQFTTIVVRPDGRPAITYLDNTAAALKLFDCTDSACTNGQIRTIASAPNFSEFGSIASRSGGNPVVSYLGGNGLQFLDCQAPGCDAGTTRLLDAVPGQPVGYWNRVVTRQDGRPVVVYVGNPVVEQSSLRVYSCTNSSCSSGAVAVLESGEFVRVEPSIALRSDGRPVISYYDETSRDLRLHICATSTCGASP